MDKDHDDAEPKGNQYGTCNASSQEHLRNYKCKGFRPTIYSYKPGPAEKGYDEYLETVLETDPKVKALLETEQEKQ